jgi:hypothetical protein
MQIDYNRFFCRLKSNILKIFYIIRYIYFIIIEKYPKTRSFLSASLWVSHVLSLRIRRETVDSAPLAGAAEI